MLRYLLSLGVGSSFGFTIPFVVVGSTTVSVKAANQSVHPNFNHFGRLKTKIILPSLSIQMLPLKNRLLSRCRVSAVSNCIITKNSTETTAGRREKEERERDRNKRKSESFALPHMVQTCNGGYSHTGVPYVQNREPGSCNVRGNAEAVGEILLSEHEDDDRSVFRFHSDAPMEDPFESRIGTMMMKVRGDADNDGEIDGNIEEEREARTLISDIDADSNKCCVTNLPIDIGASSLTAASHCRAPFAISESFAASGSVFDGYTERKMTFLLVDGNHVLKVLCKIMLHWMYCSLSRLHPSSLPATTDLFLRYYRTFSAIFFYRKT